MSTTNVVKPPAEHARRRGWMIIEGESDNGDFDGYIVGPENPRGANLAWENPIEMREVRPGEITLPIELVTELFKKWDGLGKYKDDDFGDVETVIEQLRKHLPEGQSTYVKR